MNKLITPEISEDLRNKRLLSINESCHYLSVGRNTIYSFLTEIGALRKIGRRTLADREVIDEYFNNLKEG